jgi:hypothetical protein
MMFAKALRWLGFGALALVAGFVLLPHRAPGPKSGGMKTTKKAATAKSTPTPRRRAAAASKRASREAFVSEVKAVAARIDAGKERMYTREEILRDLEV